MAPAVSFSVFIFFLWMAGWLPQNSMLITSSPPLKPLPPSTAFLPSQVMLKEVRGLHGVLSDWASSFPRSNVSCVSWSLSVLLFFPNIFIWNIVITLSSFSFRHPLPCSSLQASQTPHFLSIFWSVFSMILKFNHYELLLFWGNTYWIQGFRHVRPVLSDCAHHCLIVWQWLLFWECH